MKWSIFFISAFREHPFKGKICFDNKYQRDYPKNIKKD